MNYKRILICIFIVINCISTLAFAVVKPAATTNRTYSSFTSELNQIVSHAPANTHIGIIVQSLQTGRILYSYDADYLFMPASVQKLFVAISALSLLKPDYQFKTEVITNGTVENGVLKGDIAIRFSGDPTLKRFDIINLIAQLKARGIHTITGHVYIDSTAYDTVPYPPGWFWDDLSYKYAAPVNAVILNENQFALILTPANTINTPAIVNTSLPLGVVKIQNETITTSKNEPNCPVAIYSDFNDTYQITGCVPQHGGKQYRSLALRDPPIYAQVLVENALRNNQINFTAPAMITRWPTNFTQVLTEHDSAPLYLIVKTMLKHSDNLITDTLLKKIGQKYYGSQGTWRNGIYAMRNILGKNAGVNFDKILIADGAGLSRYNLLSPHALLKILYYAYHQNQVIPYLLNALPIAGVDGTLRWRMPNLAKSQSVHAKTGSMHGVSALAGYVNTNNNGPLAFVIMVNGFVGHNYPYRGFQDKVVEYLAVAPRT